MNTRNKLIYVLPILVTFAILVGSLQSFALTPAERLEFSKRNLSGPRLGVTYVTSDNALSRYLETKEIGQQISQFGWHFEHQIIPKGGGPQFVLQLTPLVGGVEYGKIIPGVTGAMGIRFPNGFEFGLGPNVTAGTGETSPTALMIGIGKSFNYGGVSIPLNIVYVTNPDGARVSAIIGYAINRR
ncbi:hypothetical protein KKC97_03065 [bacterium]|nr:hypothetical protein [bacterium]MBU1919805.1 hypothetical protein [bacterium]